ncbi:MAG: hypothetical protein MRY79_00765 [Alphaproteobacteria bacterium]|nr:hypothetical protein [Alphaproteobacteria bacterium]
MFVDIAWRAGGEPPRRPKKEFIASSKGYPAQRDPAAENPTGVLPQNISKGAQHKLSQRYTKKYSL